MPLTQVTEITSKQGCGKAGETGCQDEVVNTSWTFQTRHDTFKDSYFIFRLTLQPRVHFGSRKAVTWLTSCWPFKICLCQFVQHEMLALKNTYQSEITIIVKVGLFLSNWNSKSTTMWYVFNHNDCLTIKSTTLTYIICIFYYSLTK